MYDNNTLAAGQLSSPKTVLESAFDGLTNTINLTADCVHKLRNRLEDAGLLAPPTPGMDNAGEVAGNPHRSSFIAALHARENEVSALMTELESLLARAVF